jgi:hypothetical protein
LPVYINLMDLPYDATPKELWQIMSSSSVASFMTIYPGYEQKTFVHKRGGGLDIFLKAIEDMLKSNLNAKVKFIFLVDEAKRILGHRFPRGVQDNIFSILYGEYSNIGDSIGIIFTGAQDLYKFGEDDTSSIASRAAVQFVPCLDKSIISEITKALGGSLANPSTIDLIYSLSGGHAGLLVRLCQLILCDETILDDGGVAIKNKITSENIPLIRTWADNLSNEAKCLQNLLAVDKQISLSRAVNTIKLSNLNPLKTDIAIEELLFTGLVSYKDKIINSTNQIYWEYIANFIKIEPIQDESELQVFKNIKNVEISLRKVITIKFKTRWPTNWEDKINSLLSVEERSKLGRISHDVEKQYPFSPNSAKYEFLDFLYLGQLLNIIISNTGWSLFSHMFRDKRSLEDIQKAISPVRNDLAHFRPTPVKELTRCNVACDDLLVILEKELLSE